MVEIKLTNLEEQTNSRDTVWYPRQKNIVVDDTGFEDDIIVDYEAAATAITDIPDEYHEFLVSWPVVHLMNVSDTEAADYNDKVQQIQIHKGMMDVVLDDIARTYSASSEPSKIRNVWG
jgi:hypothetical protein